MKVTFAFISFHLSPLQPVHFYPKQYTLLTLLISQVIIVKVGRCGWHCMFRTVTVVSFFLHVWGVKIWILSCIWFEVYCTWTDCMTKVAHKQIRSDLAQSSVRSDLICFGPIWFPSARQPFSVRLYLCGPKPSVCARRVVRCLKEKETVSDEFCWHLSK